MPPSAESAVMELIRLAKWQAQEIETLKARLYGPDGAMEIIAAQGEKLQANNERVADLPAVQTPMGPLPSKPVANKRGK